MANLTVFEFATAARILFGAGSVKEVMPAAKRMGSRVLLVTGKSMTRAKAAGLDGVHFAVSGEPLIETIRQGTAMARGERCDVVIGFGGGSAIDAGKAIAAMLANPGDPLDYLEVIGAGKPLENSPAPFIAVPTTAGTGSEVTRNAVLGSPEHKVKASLRSASMLPRLAVVDPELTFDLPPDLTAATGLDALTQLIEPYVSIRANTLIDPICREGMRRVSRSLVEAYKNGSNLEARTDLALGSLYGGMALANAGLGAVHGFAAAIGGMYPAPHGAVCAALLPHVMEANVKAMRARDSRGERLKRYKTLARLITGVSSANADVGLEWVKETVERLNIPKLGSYGVTEADFDVVATKASNANSMKGNPVTLTDEEMKEILRRSL